MAIDSPVPTQPEEERFAALEGTTERVEVVARTDRRRVEVPPTLSEALPSPGHQLTRPDEGDTQGARGVTVRIAPALLVEPYVLATSTA